MMLNYYQIDQFTRRTVSLLEKHGIYDQFYRMANELK